MNDRADDSCVNLIVVCCYSFSSDRIGRRWPVIIAYSVICATLFLMGGLYYVHSSQAAGGVLVSTPLPFQAGLTTRLPQHACGMRRSPSCKTSTGSWPLSFHLHR